MTVGQYIQQGTAQLASAGIDTARLDTLIFIEDVTGMERASLLAHPEVTLTSPQIASLNTYITQRSRHIPVAYIRGKSLFYGREFIVNASVLVPRPETETMISMLLDISQTLPAQPHIVDIGTGSGCIGITVALEVPGSEVLLSDADAAALQVAAKNVQKHKAHAHLVHSDLLTNIRDPFDVVLSNLPYVPNGYTINTAATFEPKQALFAGDDGLDLYRVFWQQLGGELPKPSHVFTESLAFQHAELEALANNAGYTLVKTKDLIQHFAATT